MATAQPDAPQSVDEAAQYGLPANTGKPLSGPPGRGAPVVTLKASLLTAALFALLLLSWLLWRGLNSDAVLTDEALEAADRYQVLESYVRRDVLSMRVGLLSDYDPLLRHRRDLDRARQSLQVATQPIADASAAADRLSAAVERQGDLIERFKKNNAVVRSSLQAFGLLSVTFSASNSNSPLLPAVSTLNAAILESTLNSSSEVNQIARNKLDELAAVVRPLSTTRLQPC